MNAFGDAALLSIVEQHASTLQHLTLAGCKGITWSGVEGLKVKGGAIFCWSFGLLSMLVS